jgi:hypothetical protein
MAFAELQCYGTYLFTFSFRLLFCKDTEEFHLNQQGNPLQLSGSADKSNGKQIFQPHV